MTETPDSAVAALAVQLAALRGEVRMLNRRLDRQRVEFRFNV